MSLKASGYVLAVALSLVVLAAAISFAQTTPPFTGEVNSANINVRCDSTSGSEIICQAKKGARVEVISESYGWFKIRLPKQAPSYVKKDFFECVNYESIPGSSFRAAVEDGKRCISAKAAKDRINIRLKANEKSPILGQVNEKEVVNIVKDSDGWYRIEPIQNSFGWINKKFVDKAIDIKKRK